MHGCAARSVRVNERRYFIVRADPQKIRFELIARAKIHRVGRIRKAQFFQKNVDLVAIRRGPGIEVEHAFF